MTSSSIVQPTSVTSGTLGLIYSNEMVTMYYNDGTGWQQLGPSESLAGFTGPFTFDMGAGVNGAGSVTVGIPSVQYALISEVPVPASLLLLAPGLAGLVALKRNYIG